MGRFLKKNNPDNHRANSANSRPDGVSRTHGNGLRRFVQKQKAHSYTNKEAGGPPVICEVIG